MYKHTDQTEREAGVQLIGSLAFFVENFSPTLGSENRNEIQSQRKIFLLADGLLLVVQSRRS